MAEVIRSGVWMSHMDTGAPKIGLRAPKTRLGVHRTEVRAPNWVRVPRMGFGPSAMGSDHGDRVRDTEWGTGPGDRRKSRVLTPLLEQQQIEARAKGRLGQGCGDRVASRCPKPNSGPQNH